MILLAVLASVLGLIAEVGGIKSLQAHERVRLAASIAKLEIETGIVDAPPYMWSKLSAPKAFVLSRREAAILSRANSGHGTTPAENAVLREASYRRWYARQSK